MSFLRPLTLEWEEASFPFYVGLLTPVSWSSSEEDLMELFQEGYEEFGTV